MDKEEEDPEFYETEIWGQNLGEQERLGSASISACYNLITQVTTLGFKA